jgi:hypothetical protein
MVGKLKGFREGRKEKKVPQGRGNFWSTAQIKSCHYGLLPTVRKTVDIETQIRKGDEHNTQIF